MKKRLSFLLFVVVCLSCGGGGGNDAGDGGSPQITKDYLRVQSSLELLSEGQTETITITANCNWTISKDVDWLTVSPMSGSNTQSVNISAPKNSTDQDRTAILTVSGGSAPTQRLTVTQKKVVVQLAMSVDQTSLEFEKDGGSQNLVITSNTRWDISCPSWCTLSTKSGSGNATITISVGKNDKTELRSDQIIVNGEGVNTIHVSVSQKPGDKNTNEPNPDDNQPPT